MWLESKAVIHVVDMIFDEFQEDGEKRDGIAKFCCQLRVMGKQRLYVEVLGIQYLSRKASTSLLFHVLVLAHVRKKAHGSDRLEVFVLHLCVKYCYVQISLIEGIGWYLSYPPQHFRSESLASICRKDIASQPCLAQLELEVQNPLR